MDGKIKKMENVEDFKKVYKVFSEPPYNEEYARGEIEKIFDEYNQNGYIYGVYNEDECVGLVAIERGAKKDQPVKYDDENTMYLADVAVLDKYRRTGLGSQLMLYAVLQSKALGYKKMYMRTLEKGKSMSYGIAKKIGFKLIPNVYQDVERERTDGTIGTLKNIFLEINLVDLDKTTAINAIKRVCEKDVYEKDAGLEK
jgi:GNAT superfamily N-acetyltransferase